MFTTENLYSNTVYNAQKAATLSYYDAAISELTQTIALESKQKADEAVYCNLLAATQAEIIDNLFEDLEEIAPDDDDGITNWLGSLQTSGSAIGTVATTEQSARSGRNSANTTALNNLKTVLATERSATEAAADRLYRNTEQSAWNTYLTSVQSANTTYLGSIKTSENTYKTASDAADAAYRTASVTAYTNYHQAVHALDIAFYAAVSDATDPTFTTTAYFTTTDANPNLSYQKTTLANTQSKGGLWDSIQNAATVAYEVSTTFAVYGVQRSANTAIGIFNRGMVNTINAIAEVEENVGILNPDNPVRMPEIPRVDFGVIPEAPKLADNLALQYVTPYNSGVFEYTDDGHLKEASLKARKDFLMSWAVQHGAKPDGIARSFIVNDWTSVFSINPSIDQFTIPTDDGDVFVARQTSFWTGGMYDFQMKGKFTVTIPKNTNIHGLYEVSVTGMDSQWRWVDCIDAHSFMEYEWSVNSIGQGILEGIVDIVGDKMLGMSYDVHIIFYDTFDMNFDYSKRFMKLKE